MFKRPLARAYGVSVKDEIVLILTPEEVSVINSIRRPNVSKVVVQKLEEGIFIDETRKEKAHNIELIEKTLSPYLKKLNFGKITLDFNQGKLNNLSVVTKKKIERN